MTSLSVITGWQPICISSIIKLILYICWSPIGLSCRKAAHFIQQWSQPDQLVCNPTKDHGNKFRLVAKEWHIDQQSILSLPSLSPSSSYQGSLFSIFEKISTRYWTRRMQLQTILQTSPHGGCTLGSHLQTLLNCQWESLQRWNVTFAPTLTQQQSWLIPSNTRFLITSACSLKPRLPSYCPMCELLPGTSDWRHQQLLFKR